MGDSFALKRIKDLMWALVFAAVVVGVGRLVFGLGASTNMMDSLPWGLWKIFNMVAGAALATSGFVIACVIYILKWEKYQSVARLSILVGFLGYGASLTALIFDIGLPHCGWHPFFMWNPHSFLFEVFWCVSCYWSVTALELFPLITERFPFPKFTHFLHKVMLPFVILGITLSTMHHSSLGSLFMASPTRLHPLWHSMWIPPEFMISAIGAGLSVIVLIMVACSKLYNRKLNMPVISGLAKGSACFLGLYLVIKIADFSINNKWSYVFGKEMSWESQVFWAEILLQAILPVAIFMIPKFRRSVFALTIGTSFAFVGIILHRMNVGVIGYFRSAEAVYVPNISEFLLSFGVISGAGLLFFFFIEKFYIFDAPDHDHSHKDAHDGHAVEIKVWTWKEVRSLITGAGASRAILIGIFVIPICIFGLRNQATGSFKPIAQPVEPYIATDEMRTEFRIDGDRAGVYTDFTHKKHQELMGDDSSCIKCHHINLPNDHNTSCRLCHRDMALSTNIFDIKAHEKRLSSAEDLKILHDGPNDINKCISCHEDNMRGLTSYKMKGFSHKAPGYKQAMHGKCLTCHRLEEKNPADPLSLGNCQACHKLENPAKPVKSEK